MRNLPRQEGGEGVPDRGSLASESRAACTPSRPMVQDWERRTGREKKEQAAFIVNFYVLGAILRVMHEFYHLILTPAGYCFPQLQIRKLMSKEAK